MANYKLSREAEEDLYRIWSYGLETFGQTQADAYFHRLTKCFENIAKQPLLYPRVDYIRKGYHRCVCGVDSIFYRIEADTVEIIRVLGRQDTDEVF